MRFLALMMIGLLLWSCGYGDDDNDDPPVIQAPDVNIIIEDPNNPRQPPPSGGDLQVSFSDFDRVSDRKCKSCHPSDKFLQNEESLLASRVWEMVKNNMMPPGAPLQGEDRDIVLGFFSERSKEGS